MSKKLYAAFVPVLAVVAFMGLPAAAQAQHWIVCEKKAASKYSDSECQKKVGGSFERVSPANGVANEVQIISFGKLKLTFGLIVIECKVLNAGNIWNEPAAGKDNIEVFVNYECKSAQCATVSITAAKLPWPTELAAGPIDKIGTVANPIEISVNCSGTVVPFKGQLSPKLVAPTEGEPLTALFDGTTGELENAAGEKAKVEEKVRLLGWRHGEDIYVE
jgi:hypothetical protein